MIRCMGCMTEYGEGYPACPVCGAVRGTPAREAFHLAPETILAGRYIVGKVLGFGGFGVTYIGYDAMLERTVAVKEFLPTTFATRMPGGTAVTVYEGNASRQFGFGLERFVEEARRLAQFNGIPGITDIYDTFMENNTAYIVMEFLKGRDVKRLLSEEGALPFERARDIVLAVCDCLAPVHGKGIIHRDISPDNIFLTDGGEVKLLDFGAARYESSVNSKSLSVILKSGYAPEEQYRSKGEQGPWTDVYALAATFYKMLTGITPPDSMERAVRDEIKEPSKLGAVLPQGAENAILNALNIRKADRTQSVAAFKAALGTRAVERVKVKRRRQSGKLPGVAVAALCVAGAFVIALFAFSPASPVQIVNTALPEENFGVPGEGQVTVPDLGGMAEAEAVAALTELGLVAETAGPVIVEGSVPGSVASQEPLAGRFADPGGTVTLTLAAGGMREAMDGGYIPQLVGMSAYEAAYLVTTLEQYGVEYINPGFIYEYSNTVPEGTVTRFFRGEEDNGRDINIFVSAGRDNAAPPFGEARAPFIYVENGVMNLRVAAASATIPGDSEDSYNRTYFDLEVSRDGEEWQVLQGDGTGRIYPDDPEMLADPPVMTAGMYLAEVNWQLPVDEMLGGPWRLRLNVSGDPADSNAPRSELGALPMEQAYTLSTEGEPIRIDEASVIPFEELPALVESGALLDSDLQDWAEHREMMNEEGYAVFRLKGNFIANKRYNVMQSYDSTEERCMTDGELLFQLTDRWFDEDGRAEVLVIGEVINTLSPDGMEITATTPPPAKHTLRRN